MKRFASVLVRRRRIILALTLLCCCISLVLIPQVEINTDMTKYLPDDSSMQQGMDIMEVEFPDTELAKTIRVMFQGLEEEQIPEILATLESIEYVDSVAYEAARLRSGPSRRRWRRISPPLTWSTRTTAPTPWTCPPGWWCWR